MAMTLASLGIQFSTIDEAKDQLKQKGFTAKVILDDNDMRSLFNLLSTDPRYRLTPPDDLRYLEGLLELPKNFMKGFGYIPASGSEKCVCGREPTVLDIIVTAIRGNIHPKSLIRDTIIGLNNIFEIADAGRAGACVNCGRLIIFVRYGWHNPAYLYA